MSWRVTLHCTRAEAEALPESSDLFTFADEPPVIVADEPDPHSPDDWRIHAYFAEQPTTQELVLLRRLAANGEPDVEHLEDTTDWVTMSQSGLGPIRAKFEGRNDGSKVASKHSIALFPAELCHSPHAILQSFL